MQSLLTALVPLITSGGVFLLTAGIKKLGAVKYSDNKATILRAVAAILSFGGVVLLSSVTHTGVDQSQISGIVDTLVMTALGFFGATGIHDLKNS